MTTMLEQQKELMEHQREFMAEMMARIPLAQNHQEQVINNKEALPPPPPAVNQQQAGEIWLYKKFKNCNGTIFKSCVDPKETED